MPGFKSRWMIPMLCRYFIPSSSPFTSFATSSSSKALPSSFLRFIYSARVPPSTNSISRYKEVSVSRKEWNLTTLQ